MQFFKIRYVKCVPIYQIESLKSIFETLQYNELEWIFCWDRVPFICGQGKLKYAFFSDYFSISEH